MSVSLMIMCQYPVTYLSLTRYPAVTYAGQGTCTAYMNVLMQAGMRAAHMPAYGSVLHAIMISSVSGHEY